MPPETAPSARPAVVLDRALLTSSEGDLRWEALDALAEQLAQRPGGWREAAAVYHELVVEPEEGERSAAWLLVPAVLASVGQRLDDAGKREVGRFLLDAVAACAHYDDFLLETLLCAIGSLGPAVLPLVGQDLAACGPKQTAWFTLIGLLDIAAEPGVGETAEALAIEYAESALRRGIAGEIDLDSAVVACWSLAHLGHTPSLGLLHQARDILKQQPSRPLNLGINEVRHAIKVLEGEEEPDDYQVHWHGGVEAWARRDWEHYQRWLTREEEARQEAFAEDFDALTRGAAMLEPPIAPLHPVGRNEPCPCRSGKKYKKCCGK